MPKRNTLTPSMVLDTRTTSPRLAVTVNDCRSTFQVEERLVCRLVDAGQLPRGGCTGRPAGYVQVTTGLSLLFDQLYNSVTSEPAFTAVTGKWSKCMAGNDFRYETPVDLWNTLDARIDRHPTPALQKIEIKISVADYHCAQMVGLVATVQRLQNMDVKYMSRALAGDLAQVTQIDARALKIAKSLHISS